MPSRKHLDSRRGYRDTLSPASGEVRFQVVVEQTDLLVVAGRDLRREVAETVRELRGQIKARILVQPEFGTSLKPVGVPPGSPPLIRAMAEAGKACGVGPMAAVAGALAQAVSEAFADETPDMLVENGGDVYMRSTRDRVAGLLGEPESGTVLGLSLAASDFPVALCASSGTIGHSLSLGTGDLVAVRARDAALADAAATALANLLKGKRDLPRVMDKARELESAGVQGVFAQYGDKLAVWGAMELAVLE